MKEIVDTLGFIQIKCLCSVKDNFNRMRRQSTHLEKIFVKDISDIQNKIQQQKNKQSDLKNGQNTLMDTSPKKISEGK